MFFIGNKFGAGVKSVWTPKQSILKHCPWIPRSHFSLLSERTPSSCECLQAYKISTEVVKSASFTLKGYVINDSSDSIMFVCMFVNACRNSTEDDNRHRVFKGTFERLLKILKGSKKWKRKRWIHSLIIILLMDWRTSVAYIRFNSIKLTIFRAIHWKFYYVCVFFCKRSKGDNIDPA